MGFLKVSHRPPDTEPAERDILGEHCERADAWLANGFGDRLSDNERLAIRHVLFARAWQAQSEMTRVGKP